MPDDLSAGLTPEQKVVRRLRLPADRRTPAVARAIVRSVLAEAQLEGLLDAALLLTTELSTNAVVHAGTDLELEAVADPDGLTVTVTDQARGMLRAGTGNGPPANVRLSLAELSDRGRGLLLVDHFATQWGTNHYASGKGVWFRLDRDDQPILDRPVAPPRPRAAVPPPPADLVDAPSLAALLDIRPDPYADEPVSEFADALLRSLSDLVGAAGGAVRVRPGDGREARLLARYGRTPSPDSPIVRAPLTLTRPATGEVALDAPDTAYVRPLTVLVAERISFAIENDRLRRADQRRQTWLTFLAEASELLAQSLDVELTLALIPQLVVPRLGRWAAVHTVDGYGNLQLDAAHHADETELPQLHASLKEAGPEAALTRLTTALTGGGQVALVRPTEGFAVPLVARGQAIGTLSVGRHLDRRQEPDEVAVLQDVARRAALAIDNARIHAERRHVAQTLQRSLLPPKLPAVDGIGFGEVYVPTTDTAEVGGDFYDVVPMRDGLLIMIGDVSGKGVQAAAVTGLVREVTRALVGSGRPLSEVLHRINQTLVERGRGRYCTLALAAVTRLPDQRLEVSLHLAGHERPVLLRNSGRTAQVGSGGTALGLLDTIECPVETIHLAPGDSLIFFTDGVTERRRGRELFGVQRLRDSAAPLASFSAQVIATRLRAATMNFSAEPPRDDIALLVIRNDSKETGA